MNVLTLDNHQHATLLAALRVYQQAMNLNGGKPPADVAEIASNGGTVAFIPESGIDDLCYGINGGPLTVTKRLAHRLSLIADCGLEEQPEPEDYDDTESAYNNGHDVASWEAAQQAKAALRLIGAEDSPATHVAEREDDGNAYTRHHRQLRGRRRRLHRHRAGARPRPDIAINHDREALAMHAANHPLTEHLRRTCGTWIPRRLRARPRRPRVVLARLQALLQGQGRQAGLEEDPRARVGGREVGAAAVLQPRRHHPRERRGVPRLGPRPRRRHAVPPAPRPHLPPLHARAPEGGLRRRGPRATRQRLRRADLAQAPLPDRALRRQADRVAGAHARPGRLPYRTAAECIDFSIPARPSSAASARWPTTPCAHRARHPEVRHRQPDPVPRGRRRPQGPVRRDRRDQPYHTITAKADTAIVVPYMVPRYGEDKKGRNGGRGARSRVALRAGAPMPTIVPTQNGAQLVAAFLAKHNGGNEATGQRLDAVRHDHRDRLEGARHVAPDEAARQVGTCEARPAA
jgi:hypothetical protein